MLAIDLEIYIQLLTIVLAFAGVYFVAKIYSMKQKIDYATLRARAFLNESFLMDIWTLILLISLFFVIHAAIELNQIAGLFSIERNIVESIKEATELGVLVCSVILVYKWFKLVDMAKLKP